MAVLDDDLRTVDGTLTEGDGGLWSPSKKVSAGAPRHIQSRYEQERARADAAEARCEDLRQAEVAARSDAGYWKWHFKSCRHRLSEAEEETKRLHRAAKGVPSLQAEVARLTTLLSEAGIESRETGKVETLRKEVARLRRSLATQSGKGTTGEARQTRPVPEQARRSEDTIRTLRKEIARLNREVVRRDKEIIRLNERVGKEKERTEGVRETAKKLSQDSLRLYREIGFLRDAEARSAKLSDENFWLRHALDVSRYGQKKLTARIAKLRAAGATLTKLPFDEAAHLRNILRRSRRQKTAIARLGKENARLRKALKAAKAGREAAEARVAVLRTARKALSKKLSGMDAELRRVLRRSRRQKSTIKSLAGENARLRRIAQRARNRVEALEADIARLRSSGAVLSRRLYGRKSEQQKKPRSGRKRGQQRGAPGHGRTQRPGLDERPEELEVPEEARVCGRCGQPYAPNGAEVSTLIEIEVIVFKRVISRERLRRTCSCMSSPAEVTAPPAPRLFVRTPYGISFWARFLFEHCACFRPVRRIAAWFTSQGLAVSPGTLANSRKRFVALFESLYEASLAHQNTAALRHADETSWRVQELRGEDNSGRAWLWTSVSRDAVCFHIDASRSAEAALKLFAEALPGTIIVCDRYSAYKRLVRLLGDKAILAYCWAHQRRDFIDAAAGQPRLEQWCQGWVGRIAAIYDLNRERLKHYDPGRKRQTAAFRKATRKLKKALDRLFDQAESELADLPDHAREARALRSLLNHREGLCVFVDKPQTPMDNNEAERILRAPAIGRGLSHGSDSEDGARFTAIMYSVVSTLLMNGIDVLRWLEAWLTACAENGGKPPDDLSPWLPWSMSEARRREFTARG